MIAAAARLKPRALISIDPVGWLRDLALKMGATHVMEPWTEQGVAPLIAEMSGGHRLRRVHRGQRPPVGGEPGPAADQKGPAASWSFSVFGAPATVDWSLIGDAKEIDIYGVSLSPFCFERAIGGIADGSLGTEGIVTHVLPLSDYKKAFETEQKARRLEGGARAVGRSGGGNTLDTKDEIIFQQLDVIQKLTENNLKRVASDLWGAPSLSPERLKGPRQAGRPAAGKA